MAIKRNEKIKEADEEYKKLIAEEKVKYLAFLDDLHERDYISGLASAEKEGIQKGSTKEKRDIARRMLKKEIDIDTILEITELSREEIEKLKKNIK